MLTPELRRRYLTERAKGFGAQTALSIAKQDMAAPRYPFLAKLGLDRPVSGTVGPYTVTVKVVEDDDYQIGDDDVTGTFGDVYAVGAIKNTVTADWGVNGVGCKWYVPSNVSLAEGATAYRKAGMSKAAALDAYREQVQREMYDDAHRRYHGVLVTVSVGMLELGNASLWGIDTIPGYDPTPYFIETAEELISEAIDMARDAIPAAIEAAEGTVTALRAALDFETN